MVSFWDYLAGIFGNVDLGSVLFISSLALTVAAIFAGLVALVLGCEKVSDRWGVWSNLWYVPSVVAPVVLIVLFGSWLGIEVSPHV